MLLNMPMAEQGLEAGAAVSTFDRVVAAGLWLPTEVALHLAGDAAEQANQTKVFTQTRIGQHGDPFEIFKIRTEDGDTGIPFNPRFGLLRKVGADELVQRLNILNGTMSPQGWRPLIPEEHEEFLDSLTPRLRADWLAIVLPTKPGLLSSYGIEYHSGLFGHSDKLLAKAELDIRDASEQGPRLTLRLARKLIINAATNRLHPL